MLRIAMVAVALLTVFASTPGWAQNAELAKFFGGYRGSGVAENDDIVNYRTTVRDFGVRIMPEGSGFRLSWATVTRRGDPNNPTVKQKDSTLVFGPTNRANVFVGVPQGDPMRGEQYAWAVVEGNTLRVNMMTVNEYGEYEMQQWDRMLSGIGMQMVYSRIRNGEVVRKVQGRLTKEAN